MRPHELVAKCQPGSAAEGWQRRLALGLLGCLLLAPALACAADARERGFIRAGMAESEVLVRIGPPDHETFTRIERGHPEEKVWSYFPHPRDAQTLTLVTLRGGVVERVQRKIVRR